MEEDREVTVESVSRPAYHGYGGFGTEEAIGRSWRMVGAARRMAHGREFNAKDSEKDEAVKTSDASCCDQSGAVREQRNGARRETGRRGWWRPTHPCGEGDAGSHQIR